MNSKASDIIAGIVSRGAAPVLKAAGFKKTALRFYRRRGEVVQVVGFQLSQGNFADKGRFYINVGIGFDKLWQMDSKPMPDRPKEHGGHFYRRLEDLLPDVPFDGNVSGSTDIDATAIELRDRMILLVSLLDPINSTDALLEQNWLHVGADLLLKARMHYVAGDFQAAIAEVKAAAAFFSNRQASTPLDIIRRENMATLQQYL